jgi:hypothetical protein
VVAIQPEGSISHFLVARGEIDQGSRMSDIKLSIEKF